jgi:hypothetical protein
MVKSRRFRMKNLEDLSSDTTEKATNNAVKTHNSQGVANEFCPTLMTQSAP